MHSLVSLPSSILPIWTHRRSFFPAKNTCSIQNFPLISTYSLSKTSTKMLPTSYRTLMKKEVTWCHFKRKVSPSYINNVALILAAKQKVKDLELLKTMNKWKGENKLRKLAHETTELFSPLTSIYRDRNQEFILSVFHLFSMDTFCSFRIILSSPQRED